MLDMDKVGWNRNKTIKLLSITIVASFLFITYAYLVETHLGFDKHTYIKMLLSLRSLYVVLFALFVSFSTLLLGAERVFKYRYLIAFILFAITVVLGISGSSIGMITQYLGSTDSDLLFGVSRPIRTDEWAVFTPMTWSQYYGDTPFSYFSDIVRATATDVFVEYGQPVRSFLMIFRPFQIGYLFLPFENGLAFFWMGRLIGLFMVSFEFGRLITNDNRRLSVVYAVMVTFAPAVQWWFAINGFVEMLFLMQLSVIVFNLFLQTQKIICKALFAFVIVVCAGGYVLTMYPAWMIPLAYILLVFIIWTFIKNKEIYRFKKTDVIIFAIPIIMLIATVLYLYKQSYTTIDIISSTVYPGKRVNNGGGFLERFFNTYTNIWYPLNEQAAYDNTCESAGFLSLFPVGIILYLRYTYYAKKRDILSVFLLIVSAFLGCYCFFAIPSFLSKITLMNLSIPSRAIVLLEYSDLLLLIRTLHLNECSELKINVWKNICTAAIVSSFVTWMAYSINNSYFSNGMVIIQFALTFALIGAVLIGFSNEKTRVISSVLIIVAVLVSGLLVNPLRMGVKSVENIPILRSVSDIVNEDPEGVWIVEGISFPYNNLLIMEGAHTINSTNVYPYIDRWESIDDDDDDSSIYNRYAHIQINYDNDPDGEFTLVAPDNFAVFVNDDELQELGVDYVFTNRVLDEYGPFHLISSVDGYYIYETSFD